MAIPFGTLTLANAVEGVIDDYPLESKIKEVIGDMDFQITVR